MLHATIDKQKKLIGKPRYTVKETKMLFVKVSDSSENSTTDEEVIELPVEPEGYILMSTLIAQFPGACGLKFKTEQSSWRGYNILFNISQNFHQPSVN